MTHDPYASEQTINEQYRAIDTLRHQVAQEKELADQLHYCLQALMKDYLIKDLDPRTDEAIISAQSLYRDLRLLWIS